MKLFFTVLIMTLMFCNFTHASKYLEYGKYKKEPNAEAYIEHLKSVESGMSFMQIKSGLKVYCKPGKLEISIDNLVQAVDIGIKEIKKGNSSAKLDKMPIEYIMIRGLVVLFPCS